MKDNYVLIGMPSSGKSTKGNKLAGHFGMRFFDTDEIIHSHAGKAPAQIVSEKGRKAFIGLQDRLISKLDVNGSVIATGGGIIYSKKAMEHLKNIGIVIFLDVPFETIKRRVSRRRSLSGRKGMSLRDMYEERRPVYLKQADMVIDCTGKEEAEIIREIIKNIDGEVEK